MKRSNLPFIAAVLAVLAVVIAYAADWIYLKQTLGLSANYLVTVSVFLAVLAVSVVGVAVYELKIKKRKGEGETKNKTK